jgi:hypothetical protein
LLHFLVFGGLLFLLFGLTQEPDRDDGRQIRVTAAQVEQLAAQFSRTWMRPPTEEEFAGLLERLRVGADPAGVGDVTLLEHAFDDASQPEITRQFGAAFADAVLEVEQGQWLGPIRSGFGAHLVLVTDRQPARLPTLAEVRPRVLREWQDARRREQKEQAYDRLRARYEITVEPAEGPQTPASSASPDSVADTR